MDGNGCSIGTHILSYKPKPAAPSSFLRVYDISIIALLNLIIQIPADDVAVYIRIAFHVIFWP